MAQRTKQAKQPKPKKNPAAVALGRRGGKKGGKARAEALTPKRRSEIARQAGRAGAAVRWGKGKPQGKPKRPQKRA